MFKRQTGEGLNNVGELPLRYKLLQQVVKPACNIRGGQTPARAVVHQHAYICQQPHQPARSQAIQYSHRNLGHGVFPQPFQNLMRSLLGLLPHLQEQVLRMRYGMDGEDPMSLTGIGRILGMSRDRVRNLERDGLAGLRRVSDQVEAYVAC